MSKPTPIIPTVGRKVWFNPSSLDLRPFPGSSDSLGQRPAMTRRVADQPFDATILAVFGVNCVNLQVIDHVGVAHFVSSVYLLQPGEERPSGGFAEWMPYQVGQAAKGAPEPEIAPAPAPAADKAPGALVPAERIHNLVASLTFATHHFEGTTSTVCIARLPNGFVAGVGHSACVSPANFSRDKGADIAMEDARAQARKRLWEMEGYALAQRMNEAGQ